MLINTHPYGDICKLTSVSVSLQCKEKNEQNVLLSTGPLQINLCVVLQVWHELVVWVVVPTRESYCWGLVHRYDMIHACCWSLQLVSDSREHS